VSRFERIGCGDGHVSPYQIGTQCFRIGTVKTHHFAPESSLVSETGKAERNDGRAVASSAEATTPQNVQVAIWSVADKAKIFIFLQLMVGMASQA